MRVYMHHLDHFSDIVPAHGLDLAVTEWVLQLNIPDVARSGFEAEVLQVPASILKFNGLYQVAIEETPLHLSKLVLHELLLLLVQLVHLSALLQAF